MDKIIKETQAIKEMQAIGADPYGIEIMKDKAIFRLVKLTNIRSPLANIIKEGMLSAGGDAAVHKLACACKVDYTDMLLMGTIRQYKHLIRNLLRQPYSGKETARKIEKLILN
jgi:dihydropteroate synthase